MIVLKRVEDPFSESFQRIVIDYWHELMPRSEIVTDPILREAYFTKRFGMTGTGSQNAWALREDTRVGFVRSTIDQANSSATIDDLYVIPQERRHGLGTAIAHALIAQFDSQGIARIDLNVRRDNPVALGFWESLGFDVALYCLRQYRDPQSGVGLKGSLSSDIDQ